MGDLRWLWRASRTMEARYVRSGYATQVELHHIASPSTPVIWKHIVKPGVPGAIMDSEMLSGAQSFQGSGAQIINDDPGGLTERDASAGGARERDHLEHSRGCMLPTFRGLMPRQVLPTAACCAEFAIPFWDDPVLRACGFDS